MPTTVQRAAILGVGTAVPTHSCSQENALEKVLRKFEPARREEKLIRMMFQRSAVAKRHGVLPVEDYWGRETDDSGQPQIVRTGEKMLNYERYAPPLAQKSAERAIASAQIDPKDITHLVTVSCTGFHAPGVDVELIGRLGLRPTTKRVHVGYMGCHGAINGLRVARGLLAAEPDGCVLLSAVELCTLHFQQEWNEEQIIGDALFADGAASLVIGSGEPSARSIRDTASCMLPASNDAMAWRIGDQGFEMKLTTAVADHIQEHLPNWLDAWLDRCGLERSQIASWIIHPGGPRIVDAVISCLDLDPSVGDHSRSVLREYGNMSSPTVLFILEREQQAKVSAPCVMMAFGPGLMAEAALLV